MNLCIGIYASGTWRATLENSGNGELPARKDKAEQGNK